MHSHINSKLKSNSLGENVIRVCKGSACYVKGTAKIIRTLEYELGVKLGETTLDKKFTLEAVECCGDCSLAPSVQINDKYFGKLSTEEIPIILDSFRNKNKIKRELRQSELK